LNYLADWARQQPADSPALLAETGLALHLMSWAAGTGRWTEAMRLSRTLQGSLALDGRWGGWSQVVELSLQTAQQLGARAAEAWALHQSGVLAMCLGDERRARASLVRALQIRQTLGDTRGADLTQNNLNVLLGGPGARGPVITGTILAPAGPIAQSSPVPVLIPLAAGDSTGLVVRTASKRLALLLVLVGITLLVVLAIPITLLTLRRQLARLPPQHSRRSNSPGSFPTPPSRRPGSSFSRWCLTISWSNQPSRGSRLPPSALPRHPVCNFHPIRSHRPRLAQPRPPAQLPRLHPPWPAPRWSRIPANIQSAGWFTRLKAAIPCR
jgi:hypothetical protein